MLPDSACDFSLALHKVEVLEDLVLVVSAEIFFAFFDLLIELGCFSLIVEGGIGFLSVVFHLNF